LSGLVILQLKKDLWLLLPDTDKKV